MTETVAQDRIRAKEVYAQGKDLNAMAIVEHAMAEIAVYLLGMDMQQANVLVRQEVG